MSDVNAPTELWTADDLLRGGPRTKHHELWDGILVVREPSGGPAEVIGARILGPLWAHVEERGLGWVTMSTQGFLLARGPDRVLSPDVAFTSKERLPEVPRAGFFPCAPDFAVEVMSPTDSWEAVVEKCGIWIAHGCAVAWAVHPGERRVVVFRPGRSPESNCEQDVAEAAPLLLEFRLPVADLFRGL